MRIVQVGGVSRAIVPVNRIVPDPEQPRKRFLKEAIEGLAQSIDEIGLRQPIVIKKLDGFQGADWKINDGECRWRAHKLLGKTEIWVVVDDGNNDLAESVAANFSRTPFTTMEIAKALKKLQEQGRTGPQIARLCGKTTSWVYQHLSMLELHPEVQDMLEPADEKRPAINFSMALSLIQLPKDIQKTVAQEIVGRGLNFTKAKHHIKRVMMAQRISGKNVKREPHQDFQAMRGFLFRVLEELVLYAETPNDHMEAIFKNRNPIDREVLVGVITQLANNLLCLSEKILVGSEPRLEGRNLKISRKK